MEYNNNIEYITKHVVPKTEKNVGGKERHRNKGCQVTHEDQLAGAHLPYLSYRYASFLQVLV